MNTKANFDLPSPFQDRRRLDPGQSESSPTLESKGLTGTLRRTAKMQTWKAGDSAMLREVHQGRVWSARPGYVVSDEGERASFYFPWNTICHWPWHAGLNLRVPADSWKLEPGRWLPYEQLHVMEVGAIHHVSVLWKRDSYEHAGWKVDFHEPARRGQFGFDALDWALDLIVKPDRSYFIKDEDEFTAYQYQGLLNPDQVAAVEAELENVIRQVEAKEGIFADSILEWRPEPGWVNVGRCQNYQPAGQPN
ncbi:MAG: DUF402 domain-containing protein [bacterium]